MEWKLVAGDQVEARVSKPDGDPAELLGDLIAMWSRDLDLHDWEGRDRMAKVAVEHSDLDQSEVQGIFGRDLNSPIIGDPPWIFKHPFDDGTIKLER